MARFGMCGKVIARPGRRDELVGVLLEAAAVLGQLPDCELYVVGTVPDEDDAIWVTELWTSEEAHAGSLGRDDVRGLIERGRPLIADFAEQVRFTPVGGKGLDPAPRAYTESSWRTRSSGLRG